MKKITSLLILVVVLLATLKVWSAIPTQRQIGGQAGTGFSLLKVQRLASPKKGIERLVFFIGTKEGFSLKGLPGYFNAQNQGKEIVLDFAQMPVSKLTEKSLREILRGSLFIKGSKMTQDPLDQTLTMKLFLNKEIKMKVIQVKGQKETARLVVDILRK